MKTTYFNKNTKVYDLVTQYPMTLGYMIDLGFTPLQNEKMLNSVGKIMSLGGACSLKGLDYDSLEENLINLIEESTRIKDVSLGDQKKVYEKPDFLMSGVLPCPIRISLLEAMEQSQALQNIAPKAQYDLQAASMGIGHIVESFSADMEKNPDVILSVGFEHFFGTKVKEEMFESGAYIFEHPKMDPRFDNPEFSLRDPKNRYFILAMVPCVFLVNKRVLGDRNIDSWKDLLKPEFENSLSIPLGDLDMFNSICLNIYKNYGYEGIEQLKRANAKSLHPAEMTNAFKKSDPPAISVIPYFFTKMVFQTDDIEVVWPKDGAILSPIYLMAKKDKQKEIDTIVDFFRSEDVAELLSANGKFPSTLQSQDSYLDESRTFQWLGWDFIDQNDIDEIIRECERIFEIDK